MIQEVISSLYAWDLLDEGTEQILDVLQQETLTNSTSWSRSCMTRSGR